MSITLNDRHINSAHNADIVLNARVEATLAEGSIALHKEQHLHMRDASGWTIKAMSGTVWITQESDSRDIVLKAGESFMLDRPGSALVAPLGEAKLCFKRENARRSESVRKVLTRLLPSFSAARALFA
jgi:hypothetical protein